MSAVPDVPLRPLVTESAARPSNPFTMVLAIVGGVLAAVGLAMMLFPDLDAYGRETGDLDLVRVLAGTGLLTTAGTLITCALAVAGFGWHLRERRRSR